MARLTLEVDTMEENLSGSGGDVPETNYEDSLKRLEEIVQRLESGQMTLDESLRLFEEGTMLIKVCQSRLTAAELRIEKLVGEGGRVEDIPSSGLGD
jgi:exodeoxyribonuclease VII small subunit